VSGRRRPLIGTVGPLRATASIAELEEARDDHLRHHHPGRGAMSDGGGFDIALLEGKDRAELVAIAQQLGEKPAARAKKADIVALIMRLVGADAPAAEAAPPAPGAASAPADEAGPDEAESTDPSPSSDDGSERSPRNDRADRTQDRTDRGERNGRNQDRGDRNQERSDRTPERSGQQEAPEPDRGNERTAPDGDGGEGAGEDGVEPGNRRRRRRGRDRDRNRDDEQVQSDPVEVEGLVDLREEGYGFLRLEGFHPSRDDAYISLRQTRQFGLRTGDVVRGKSRPAARNEKNPALLQVDDVNGYQAHNQPERARFDALTPVFPTERLALELQDDPSNLTVRAIDLLAPLGKGARALVASPPGAGKTTVLKQIVRAIEVNDPEVELLVVLVDERPEEVTDLQRWMLRGTVAASTFDRPADEHAALADLAIERAKRLVESGKDVVVVLDGLTRLVRAHNQVVAPSGRALDGGVEPAALLPVRRFFGAARKAEEGGSLTVIATVAVGTGSRADDVVFDEVRGAASTTIVLDGRLAARGAVPSLDVRASATRHDELLVDRAELPQRAALRRTLADQDGADAAHDRLSEQLQATKTNAELLAKIAPS
jgi:transcription termination factor Rho